MTDAIQADQASETGVDGWVSITDGQLHVADPQPEGQPAVISADDSVAVFVDQTPIHGPTEVYAHTHLSISLPFRTFPDYHCDFEPAADLCALDLRVRQQSPGFFYSLPDTPPTRQLLIQAEAREAPLSAFGDEILPEILHELKARRITLGVKPEAIRQALAAPGESLRVVEGAPPLNPVNRLDYRFALPTPDPEDPAGFTISYPLLRLCKAGEVLVQRERTDEVRPGLNIYGETIPPQPAPALPLKAADRTVIVDADETRATARLEGVPSFNGHEARVAPLDRRKDPLEGGPGGFYDIKGSLQADDSILNQAQVWASQHLEVAGDVSHSHLEAEDSLIVHGNTIKSHLAAGGDAAARMRLREPVERLYAQMEQILQIFREVRQAARGRAIDDKTLFLRVIKSQFHQLPAELDAIWKLLQSLRQLHPRRTMVLKVVLANLINLADRSMDERSYIDWLDKLRTLIEDLLQRETRSQHVYLGYVQGSHVVSRGSIFVLGEGCYHSELQAGGDILFCGSPGYCREGSLSAGGNVTVPELGSPNGSRLKVRLEASSRLRVGRIHPGVELHFGENLRQHLLEAHSQVEVSVSQGQIQFRPWN